MFGTGLNRFGWDMDPWRELRKLHLDVHRLFDGNRVFRTSEYPAVNLWTGADDVLLTAEIPGVGVDDLDISVQGDMVTLRGSRKAEQLHEGESYHRQERGSGDFVRTVQLPYEVDGNAVEAELSAGVLRLRLPRAAATKPKKIAIRTA